MKPSNILNHHNISAKVLPLLIAILFFRLVGFSTIGENATMAKLYKTGIGLAMTSSILLVFLWIKSKGLISSFSFKNLPILLLYCLYLLLGVLSLTWTSDIGVSSLQISRDIEMLVFSLLFTYTIVLINHYYPEQSIRLSAVLGPAIILNLSIFLIGNIVAPEIFIRKTHGGEVSRLGGQMMNPNELGMLCGVALACCFSELKQKRNYILNCLLSLIALYALFITGSRSSMIGFFLIGAYYVITSKNYSLKAAVVVLAFLCLPFIINTIFLKEGAQTGGTSSAEEVLSMTGRIPFWKALLTEGLPKEPLLGFGFMRINYTTYFQGANTYPAAMTHNTFIQVLMNLGLVGFLIVLLQMSTMVKALFGLQNLIQKELLGTMLLPILINSFTEFGIWGEVNYSILFYQIIILSMVITYNPKLSRFEKILQQKKLNL